MGEEGSDEVAEEGLSVGGFAAEMAIFEVAAGHDEDWMWGRGIKNICSRSEGRYSGCGKVVVVATKESQNANGSNPKIASPLARSLASPCYPAAAPQILISRPAARSFLFLLHTYLVGATEIKKSVCYDSSPALHIAAARVIELSSGTSLAQFLMVYLLFIMSVALCDGLEKSERVMADVE